MMGITQAIISVFLDDEDKIRCINAGKTRITFLLRPPLYYVCASSWGEPESVVSKIFHSPTAKLNHDSLVLVKEDALTS